MSKKKLNKKKIRRGDFLRVLVTETGPYETPIIFSNDRLYTNLRNPSALSPLGRKLQAKIITAAKPGQNEWMTPYHYKIKKNATQHRRLALLHPRSQWKIKEFYEKYDGQILDACSKSSLTIRSPERIASTFFVPTFSSVSNAVKTTAVSTVSDDRDTTFSVSYFSYRGFPRFYQFFDSPGFSDIEKQYDHMRMLDMSRCFDSIYTHTISWALTGKEAAKKKLKVHSFGKRFDELMQHANRGETSGIPIGPEVSRIFAEIILQRVDSEMVLAMRANHGLELNREFTVRRYVDDIVVFGNTEEVTKLVQDEYIDSLRCYNLNLNEQKTTHLRRPFATQKSRVIRECGIQSELFLNRFMQSGPHGGLVLKRIRDTRHLSESFIRTIRSLCLGENVAYEEVSTFLIAIMVRHLREISEQNSLTTPEEAANCRDALLVLFEVIFFLYTVAPSVSASYKVASGIIITSRFLGDRLLDYAATVKTRISALVGDFIRRVCATMQRIVGNHVALEVINVLLATRELGENFQLDELSVEHVFRPMISGETKWSYFDMMSCLYYIGNRPSHLLARQSIETAIDKGLQSLQSAEKDSEKAHLLLDALSCPFLNRAKREAWAAAAFLWLDGVPATVVDISTSLDSKEYWFTTWEGFDILNALQKKELRPAY
jgi:Reverse transcriptase (RNA-dependent DNA polymerase)